MSVDASNTSEGYVMAKYTGDASKVRMLIETPAENTYNYLMILDGQYKVYPLSEGSGLYKIGVYENLHDDQYKAAFTQSVNVMLKDQYSVFLYPNVYVDFNGSSKAVQKGKELAENANGELELVQNVCDYITENIVFDYDKAEKVQPGYNLNVDDTLETGTGIYFDYASLMAAMLCSQGIPTKYKVGYVDDEGYAWISVFIQDYGWIDKIIWPEEPKDKHNRKLIELPPESYYSTSSMDKEDNYEGVYHLIEKKYSY